jgi:hypothetical protein
MVTMMMNLVMTMAMMMGFTFSAFVNNNCVPTILPFSPRLQCEYFEPISVA